MIIFKAFILLIRRLVEDYVRFEIEYIYILKKTLKIRGCWFFFWQVIASIIKMQKGATQVCIQEKHLTKREHHP
jgi:hypothetical protein